METQEENKIKATVLDMRFGFVLKFEEEPTTEEFCNAMVSLFQTASVSLMQKEAISKAMVDAKKTGNKTFVFEGQTSQQGVLEARIGLLNTEPKSTKKIITQDGAIDFMSRQQRRAAERKNGK